jgi:MFS family permease
MRGRYFYGWTLLPALWVILCINVAFTMFGSTVLNPAMAIELRFSRQSLGLVFSVFTLMSGLPGPLVAMCVNRVGIRATLALGSALVGSGALLMGTVVHSAWSAALVFGVLIGAGSITGVLAAQTSAAFWFVQRRALAMSLLMTAGGGGGFIAPPLLNWAIARSGGHWQAGWWLIAVLAVAAVLIALLLVRERPEDMGQLPDGDAAASVQGGAAPMSPTDAGGWTLRQALHTPVLWLMMVAGGGLTAGFMTYLAHGVAHLHDLAHAPAVAALSMSLLSVTTLCGSLLAGVIGDRIELRYGWAVALALFGIGIYLVTGTTAAPLLYACSIMMGLGFGCATVCLMTAVGNYFGSGIYASLVGIVLAVQTIFGSAASWAAGAVYDRTGHYNATFGFICVACVLLAAGLALVRPPHHSGTPIASAHAA